MTEIRIRRRFGVFWLGAAGLAMGCGGADSALPGGTDHAAVPADGSVVAGETGVDRPSRSDGATSEPEAAASREPPSDARPGDAAPSSGSSAAPPGDSLSPEGAPPGPGSLPSDGATGTPPSPSDADRVDASTGTPPSPSDADIDATRPIVVGDAAADAGCTSVAGQACCAGGVCARGYACGDTAVCRACGEQGEPCCSAGSACNAALACIAGACEACAVTLPFPSTCTSVPIVREVASNTYPGSSPALAIDGNRCTTWNSGGGVPQSWTGYVACAAGVCPRVTQVGVLAAMSSPGPVTLEIDAIDPTGGHVLVYAPETVSMADDKYYQFPIALPADPRPKSQTELGLEIRVTGDPSWVSFREVAFLTCK